MSDYRFPSLNDTAWHDTRDTIQLVSQLMGKIRRVTTPSQKHWWHVSLRCAAAGPYTTPMPCGVQTFDLLLDLTRHELALTTNQGERWNRPLSGTSIHALADDLLSHLARLKIDVPLDPALFDDELPLAYDAASAARLWSAFSQINSVLRRFQGEIRGETSPVQLWPHNFDLALLWMTGNLVEGQDPEIAESADEQMNFGFVTGDDWIREPYFYATVYPLPKGLVESALPAPAYWHEEGFTGAILPYAALVDSTEPDQELMTFFRTAYQAGQRLMLPVA